MSVPPHSTPPLLPLPSASPPSKPPDDDPFASLFSPATPPESPLFRRARNTADSDTPLATVRRPLPLPLSTPDTDDFGAFVSVQAGADPLAFGSDPPATASTSTTTAPPATAISPFGGFFDEARDRSGKNERRVLGELLGHDGDPLYSWSHPTEQDVQKEEGPHAPRASPTPTPTFEREVNLLDLEDAITESPTPHLAPSQSSSSISTLPIQRTESPSPTLSRRSSSSPNRAKHARQESSASSISTLSRSWMSSLLSASLPSPTSATLDSAPWLQASTAPAPTTAQEATLSAAPALRRGHSAAGHERARASGPGPGPGRTDEHAHAHAHAHAHEADHPPHHGLAHASTVTGAISVRKPPDPERAITHGTPFGSHIFVPGSASGAPGFAGTGGWDTKGFAADASVARNGGPPGRELQLVGRKEQVVPLLTPELAEMIRAHLPALPRLSSTWRLQYSVEQHGFSLKTLYTRCEPTTLSPGSLVVMLDADDGLFGAWMGEGVKLGKGGYYGSGESFLWKRASPTGPLRVFKWTGKNEYVALCEPSFISFGGGDGHYGLYLDASLIDGSTARCPTFDNEPLCAGGQRKGENVAFECCGVEVWCVES